MRDKDWTFVLLQLKQVEQAACTTSQMRIIRGELSERAMLQKKQQYIETILYSLFPVTRTSAKTIFIMKADSTVAETRKATHSKPNFGKFKEKGDP